jgi:hypothetical protein
MRYRDVSLFAQSDSCNGLAMGLQWACNGVHEPHPIMYINVTKPHCRHIKMQLQAHCRPIAGPLRAHCGNCCSHCKPIAVAHCKPRGTECGPIAGPLQAHCEPIAMYKQSRIASLIARSSPTRPQDPSQASSQAHCDLQCNIADGTYYMYHHLDVSGQFHVPPPTETDLFCGFRVSHAPLSTTYV